MDAEWEKELDKTVMLCLHCHKIEHFGGKRLECQGATIGYRYNPFTGDFDRIEDTGAALDDIETVTGNDGIPVGPDAAQNLNLLGDNTQGIDISGDPITFTTTVTAFDATETQIGVSELATDAEAIAGSDSTRTIVPTSLKAKLGVQTLNTIPYGGGSTAALNWLTALTDGQLIIGSTGNNPQIGNLTSTGATVIITNGSGTINLETAGAVATTYDCDVGSAVPAAGILTLTGSTAVAGTSPLSTSGAGSTVTTIAQISQALAAADATKIGLSNFDSARFTVDATGFVSVNGTGLGETITGDAGGALSPTGGNWDILGINGLSTSGAASTLSIDISNPGVTTPLTGARIANNTYITARNAAGLGDLNLICANASDECNIAAGLTGTNFDGNIKPFGDGGGSCGVQTLRWSDIRVSGSAYVPLTANGIVLGGGITNADALTVTAAMTNGQLLIGSTGVAPVVANLTSTDSSVTITNGAGSINLAVAGGGVLWTEITAAAVALAVNNGYVLNRATLITATLPVTAAFGTVIRLCGKGAGGWIIAQNAGQNIQVGNSSSTVGVGGSVASTNQFDTIELLCSVANTTWTTLSSVGNFTIT